LEILSKLAWGRRCEREEEEEEGDKASDSLGLLEFYSSAFLFIHMANIFANI